MSDHIAHLAICDDVFRLGALHPEIHPKFKELFASHRDSAHLGSVTRTADKWSADVIDWARDEYPKPEADRNARVDDKLAFVLGSLTHRSADRLTKPITNCWGKDASNGKLNANESKIYQDVFAFREVYGSGRTPLAGPFSEDVLDAPADEAGKAFEHCFRTLWRRGLIGMHTLNPDREHIHDWLTAFFDHVQTFPKSLELYAQIARDWPADKVRQYLVEKKFYHRDDIAIQTARNIQHGCRVNSEEVVAAIAATEDTHSRWGRALRKAIEYLLAAGELFEGKINLSTARTRFDVGVPELSLQD